MRRDGNIYDANSENPDEALIEDAAKYLDKGEAVVFPTDTVYGIGVVVDDESTPDLLFQIKERERRQAIPWLIADNSDMMRYGSDVPRYCQTLADRFWPGPLTLVVNASDEVPDAFLGKDGTIALRVPDNKICFELISSVGRPLATTSANLHGKPAVDDCKDMDAQIIDEVPMVIDSGTIEGGLPSTIVACLGDEPVVIREGAISVEQVMDVYEAEVAADEDDDEEQNDI